MHHKATACDFSGQHVWMGIDVSRKSWKVCIVVNDIEHKTFSQPPTPEHLIDYIQRNFHGATYHAVYEAGYCGFWIQRQLADAGIDCIVVNPADVPSTNRDRQFKTDTVDCRKLARRLRGGDLHGIYVPSEALVAQRSFLRMRKATALKLVRVKNQIKSFLRFHGIEIPARFENSKWPRVFLAWLASLQMAHVALRQTLDGYIEELTFLRSSLLQHTRTLRQAARSQPYKALVELLVSVPGISVLGAMTLLCELEDIRRFKSLDRLAGFIGLVPSTYSSGELHQVRGLTQRGNKAVRNIIIEAAWVAVRHDPALLQCFNELIKRKPKNKAIITIARKLLARIYHVWQYQQPYRLGMGLDPIDCHPDVPVRNITMGNSAR